MMMVDKHTIELTEKIKNGSSPKKIVKSNSDKPINDVTTQMMMSGDPPFKNHSQILIWTDREERDIFRFFCNTFSFYLDSIFEVFRLKISLEIGRFLAVQISGISELFFDLLQYVQGSSCNAVF